MTYSLKVNRTTVHIAGLEERSTGAGRELNGAVSYYPESACGALTRGSFSSVGKATDSPAEALRAAQTNAKINRRKVCKHCEKAAQAHAEVHAAVTELPPVALRDRWGNPAVASI